MWPLWLLVMSAQTSRHASSPAGGTRPSITGGGGSCHETDKKAARNCRTVPSNADILPITVVAARGQTRAAAPPHVPLPGGPPPPTTPQPAAPTLPRDRQSRPPPQTPTS